MGKSKRIRSDRALDGVNNPNLNGKNDSNRKANKTSIILVSIIAAILIVTISLVAISSSGVTLRAQTVYSTENFKVDGAMFTYMYEELASSYFYNLYSMWANAGLDPTQYYSMIYNSAYSQASTAVKTNVKTYLVACEAAKAEGMTLSDANKKIIDKTLETIKNNAKESNKSISQIYGNKGINESDIRRSLELQLLASQYNEAHGESIRGSLTDDEIKKYLDEHVTEFYKGEYVKASTSDSEFRVLLSKAKDVDEFLRLYTEKYVKDHLTTDTGSALGTPSASLCEALVKTFADELKYSLLNTEIAGVSFTEKDATADRLKKIFEAKYKDSVDKTQVGLAEPTDAIYSKLAKADVSALTKNSSVADIEAAVQKIVDDAYKKDVEALPAKADLEKFNDTLVADLLYTMFEKKAEGVEDFTDTEKDKTVERIKKVFKVKNAADAENIEDKLYETVAKVADTMNKNLGKDLVKTSYPTESDSTASDDEKAFDKWFFEDGRAEGDIYTEDKDNVYVVMAPKSLDEETTKNAAHLLVKVNATKASDSATDAEKAEIEAENNKLYAEALEKAQEYLGEFNKGDKTLQSFKDLAKLYTADSGVTYYGIYKDQMVKEFNDWVFDVNRKAGDVEIVKTEYGQHIIYFIGEGLPKWKAQVTEALVSKKLEDLETANAEKYKVTENAGVASSIAK